MIYIFYEPQKCFLCQIVGVFPAAGLIAAEIIDVVIVSVGNLVQVFSLSFLNPPD